MDVCADALNEGENAHYCRAKQNEHHESDRYRLVQLCIANALERPSKEQFNKNGKRDGGDQSRNLVAVLVQFVHDLSLLLLITRAQRFLLHLLWLAQAIDEVARFGRKAIDSNIFFFVVLFGEIHAFKVIGDLVASVRAFLQKLA